MSTDGRRSIKRKVESDDETDVIESEVQRKIIKIAPSPPPESDDNANDESSIDEAIKTLDRIQYELNMNNILLESPDSSDNDTPPESDDEEDGNHPDDMMSDAHALGFAACIRETFQFLDSCGINENDPIYMQLKSRFVGTTN